MAYCLPFSSGIYFAFCFFPPLRHGRVAQPEFGLVIFLPLPFQCGIIGLYYYMWPHSLIFSYNEHKSMQRGDFVLCLPYKYVVVNRSWRFAERIKSWHSLIVPLGISWRLMQRRLRDCWQVVCQETTSPKLPLLSVLALSFSDTESDFASMKIKSDFQDS